jgi:alpha-L-fucosidase
METYAFLHFTINTFTDKEWGYGDEDPKLFHPTAFDADAIIRALKDGGMRGVILTCKHHDGFCLWPTKTTTHSVRSSGWKGGNGDVVREISKAAAAHGLKFGVYLSPWDRNNAAYGRPEYIDIYRAQLRELLTQYGPIFEVWHDGANGGDGYYGGAREKRLIDKRTYYDWPNTWALVRNLQPAAVIFSDVGPDVRWVGNERGYANETCWATYDPVAPDGGPAAPGLVREKDLTTGTPNGSRWLPAECDVSIRPGWFWHEKEHDKVKSAQQLLDLYFKSVGRGASFLLNVPPDRRGQLSERDVASLARFGYYLRFTESSALQPYAKPKASNVRGNDRRYGPEWLLDRSLDTYWTTDDGITTPEVVLNFLSSMRPLPAFNLIRLREYLPLGQRVEEFAVDAWIGDAWKQVAGATSIGASRLILLDTDVAASAIRLRITRAAAPPAIATFELYQFPRV